MVVKHKWYMRWPYKPETVGSSPITTIHLLCVMLLVVLFVALCVALGVMFCLSLDEVLT